MRDSLHGGRFAEIREAGMKAEDLMARYAKPIEGDFIGQNFRNQIIDVMNATYQIKNIPLNVEYTDKRKRLMLDFLPPEPQQILSNTATEREGVDIKKTGAFYKTDKPENPNSINNIFRIQSAIQKERIKMMNDPKHIAMLLEVKEKADKAPKRGRPVKKLQPNSQAETFDWMAPQFDPFRSSSQVPLVYTEEKDFISDDNDNEDITSRRIVPFLEDADGANSDKNLRRVIPDEGNTPSTSFGYQEGRGKSQTHSSSVKGRRTQSDFIYRPKKKSNSDIPLQVTDEIRTSEADEPLALGFQSESETSSCVEDDPEHIAMLLKIKEEADKTRKEEDQ
jgi:hypothetical protein